ncbi:helix-turn-helix domain-containing protein [Bacillus pumilus]|uniref:helix-turn-helix domain-containing protein n=1 Tax=Bacillus pumilus TaxID=1408 RepID=UPI00017A5E76|nr:helix-turn-helix domain-containing protein [Bacillus pumilus]EDW22391.1 conserved domain protein [Bacillus pumilus ATCC 7061]MBB6600760.1 helix-turn-helix domain-containing protein [Bacillus pumilus]MBU8576039.1 helix-turn-helix domain-containing protein [Bacillus pumilus]MCR4352127.1 helix-turn-helix domain-containing protein [Bacillus pumilus]MCY7506337.1 helix-turn-helix domain-containing protein [Bacillus pumilus]
MPTKSTMNVQETADFLGVHHDTVYTMVKERQIPFFRVRKRILFKREVLEEWQLAQMESNFQPVID